MEELSLGERIAQAVGGELRKIEGRMKTFIEAITENSDQCEARKSIVEIAIWQTTQYLFDYIRQEADKK